MSGLDKIIADIGESSKEQCSEIIANAKEAADNYTKAEQQKIDAEHTSLVEKAKKQAEAADHALTFSGEMQLRQNILAAKVTVIDSVIAEAVDQILNLDTARYFDAVTAVAAGAAHPGKGFVRFNEADRKRLPADYIVKLNTALKDGAQLSLDEKTANIRGGCILIYGDIEENCSFEAIAASMHDELRDKAFELLF